MATDPTSNVGLMQTRFDGGMNAFGAASAIADNEYWFLRNARVRTSEITPIKKCTKINTPSGSKYQGLEAVDHYLVLFVDGEAYYKDLLASGNFVKISGFLLSATVEKLYSVLVPQSFRNNVRTATDPSSGVILKSTTSGTPGALVVQDGISQPRLIASDGTTRQIQDYSQWASPDDREYVPVGKQMLWTGNILFIVAPDNKQIYRSVTGRPLDFVIAIDNDGNKLLDASGTSHSVDYNDISALIPISGNGDVALAVSSLNNTRMMISDGTADFYGEPQFNNPSLFSTGAINESSFSDILSDTVFIDQNGLRSFNAVRQQKVASNSNVFSKRVSSFFEGVTQDITAVGSFQNYELFAVKTVYGYGVLVFDSDLNTFVAFDQYTGVTGAIKKFVTTKVNGAYKLFFLTTNNEVFEAFSSSEYEVATFYGKELSTDNIKSLITPLYVHTQLEYSPQSGTIQADVLVDKVSINGYPISVAATDIPLTYPLQDSGNQVSEPVTFKVNYARPGFTVGVRLVWNTGSPVSNVLLLTTATSYNVPPTAKFVYNQ